MTTTFPDNKPITFKLPALRFAAAWTVVSHTASTGQARPILTAVLMERTETGLRLVSTDSYRLAVVDIPDAKIPGAARLPAVGWSAMIECTKDLTRDLKASAKATIVKYAGTVDETPMVLTFTPSVAGDRTYGGSVTFTTPGRTITANVLDGTYPNYRGLIPEAAGVGSGVSGPAAVAFNPTYLADLPKMAAAAEMFGGKSQTPIKLVHVADALKPVLWTWGDTTGHGDAPGFLFLLMPVRAS